MEELYTKQERYAIYVRAKTMFTTAKFSGICAAIYAAMAEMGNNDKYDNIDWSNGCQIPYYFPELLAKKPIDGKITEYWWPITSEFYETRLNVLNEIINNFHHE